MKFLARKKDIRFQEGPWVDRCNYTIDLECECIYFGDKEICAFGSVDDLVDEFWDIELADDTQERYRITHTLFAQFPDSRNSDGTLNVKGCIRAKEAIQAKLGPNSDRLKQIGVLNVPDSYQFFNHNRVVNENQSEGSYRVVESWISVVNSSNPHYEDYTLSISEQNGILTSRIDGTINGLFTRDVNFQIDKTKLVNAQAAWATIEPALFTRCQSATEKILNPVAVNRQKVQNVKSGIITYSYEFNTRSNFGLSGARQVDVTVQDVLPSDIFASIPVVNRLKGPILQPINSVTQSSRIISIDVILDPIDYNTTVPPTVPNVMPIIQYYTPTGVSQLFLSQNTQNFVIKEGRYQRVVGYVYQ